MKNKQLRNILNWETSQNDLNVLLEKPFEIDGQDFPLIAVIGDNHRQEKIKRTNLSDLRPVLDYNDSTDCSSEAKIGLSYAYHYLKNKGASKGTLKNLTKIIDGIVLNIGRPGMFDPEDEKVMKNIWPEYYDKLPKMVKKYEEALGEIKSSPENPLIVKAMDNRATYLENLLDGETFTSEQLTGKNYDKDDREYLSLRFSHNFKTALQYDMRDLFKRD